MSNLNKWNEWYVGIENPEPYGDTETYQMGAAFLWNCETVEDWGCGKGWFRNFRKDGYIGIDGTWSKFADRHEDLEEYRSHPEGIFMRHVLEHNYGWEKVLDNALASFTKKMFLVLFTPLVEKTKQIDFIESVGVPDIAFNEYDIIARFPDNVAWSMETIESAGTAYGEETIFRLSKRG